MLVVFILQMLVFQPLNCNVETIDRYFILFVVLSETFVDLHYLGELFPQVFGELLVIALECVLADLFHEAGQGVFLFSDVPHLRLQLFDQ